MSPESRGKPAHGGREERRREERLGAGGFPLLAPAAATIIDCGRRGLGIETTSHLAVGSLTSVNVYAPKGTLELLGRVCWARLVGSRGRGEGESEPVFRAGLSFVDGQALEAWEGLRDCLTVAGVDGRRAARPRRRVVKWRRPRAG